MGISWQYSSHIGWGNTQPKPIVTHGTSDQQQQAGYNSPLWYRSGGIGENLNSLVGKHDTNKITGSGIGCKLQLSYASRIHWTVLAVLYTTRQSNGQQFSSDVWVSLVQVIVKVKMDK